MPFLLSVPIFNKQAWKSFSDYDLAINPEKLPFYGKTGNRTKFVREFFPIKFADIYDKFDGLIMYRVESAFEPPTL